MSPPLRTARARSTATCVMGALLLAACGSPEPRTPAEQLWAHTKQITAVGPRLSGTPGEAAAQQIIEQMFTDAGLRDVRADPFTWNPWQPASGTLTVGGTTLTIEALSPTGPTQGVTLPLVDPTLGDIAGGLAVYQGSAASRAEQFFDATSRGAEAMIRVGDIADHDGSPLIEVGHTLDGASLVALAIPTDGGRTLQTLWGQQATIDIVPGVVEGHTSYNVHGRVPGTSGSTVWVTAHYDSWHLSESAIDNALGVAMMVQLATWLRDHPPRHDVVFLATSGEEQGLRGATAWVEAHEDLVKPGDVVVTLDIPWSHEGTFTCAAEMPVHEQITPIADALGFDVTQVAFVPPASDHFPFQLRGASPVWCTRQPDRHYHSGNDTMDWLDPDEVFRAFTFHRTLIATLAGSTSTAP